jgi:hypothetical protein
MFLFPRSVKTSASNNNQQNRDAILDECISDIVKQQKMKYEGERKEKELCSNNENYIVPIFDQSNSSCCVSCTITNMKNRQDSVSNYNPYFIYNLRSNEVDDGMSIREALTIGYTYGLALFQDYPYHRVLMNKDNRTILQPSLLAKTKPHHLSSYGTLYNVETAQQMMTKLPNFQSLFGCLMIVLPVYNRQTVFWDKRMSMLDVLKETEYHCVSFVNYNKSTEQFRLQNSWGVEYADQGYTDFPAHKWNELVVESNFGTSNTDISNLFHQHLSETKDYHDYIDGDVDENSNEVEGGPVDLTYINNTKMTLLDRVKQKFVK